MRDGNTIEARFEDDRSYLFADEASLEEYLDGSTMAQVKGQLRNVSVKQFGVMEELTEITRGPIK